MFFRKDKKKDENRQSWEPNAFLRILHGLWVAALAVLKIAVGAAATVACIGVVCGLVLIGLLGNFLQDDVIPNAGFSLDKYKLDQTSFVYYTDEKDDIQLLQRIYTSVDRRWAEYDEIPEDLIHAAVAIEDKRFYEHQGVDWITTVKACGNIFFGGKSTFGGSTITQQLIKNLTGEDSVTVQRKVLEIFRAQQFEKHYDKKVIMEWYMNTIYLGEGCWGVKSAAATYFGKELQMLTTAECASLISITNNPSYYDPYNIDEDVGLDGRANNKERQENTLWSMKEQGWLTEEEYQQALKQDLVFKSGIADEDKLVSCSNLSCGYTDVKKNFVAGENDKYFCPVCGSETRVNSDASRRVYSWFVDTVLEDVAQDLAAADGVEWGSKETRDTYMELIRRGGFHIYSTLDMKVQNQVDAIYTNLDEIPTARSGQQLQSAIVVEDNVTGDIVAMAGGVDEKVVHDAYNRATEAKLQTGSSMKPLTVYGPAFEMGVISPATVVKDMPLTYDPYPFPRNDNFRYSYSRTVFDAVTHSVNAAAINVLDLIGTGYSYKFAKEMFGLSTLTDSYITSSGRELSDVDYAPLGMGALTVGCSVRDMTTAFATYANNGTYRKARTYTKVYDSEGNLVLDNRQESRNVLSEKTVNYMNYCLQNAVEQGTGGAAGINGIAVAGKTGTTGDFKDRWFCGFTGYYTAGIWVGYDTPERIYLTGSTSNPACRLFRKVMAPLHEGKHSIPLYDHNMSTVTVCLDSGKIATDACRNDIRGNRVQTVRLYREDMPTEVCDKHVMVEYCEEGKGIANEYCKKFAEVGMCHLVEKSLVRMTQAEINELLKAETYGLREEFLRDDYIYYVDEAGNPQNFKGLHGDANVGVNAPYLSCTMHTKAAWDAYELLHQGGIITPEPGEGGTDEDKDPGFHLPEIKWP